MAYEFAYPVVLTEDPSGGYVASCPDLPEVLSQGEDRREAVAEATDALEEAIAGRIRRGEGIPEPSAVAEDEDVEVVRVPPIMAAKAALAIALGESGLNQSAFARQIGADEKEVRRLLDPRHPSKLPRLQRALQAVNQYVELRVVRMATPEILETRPRSYRELVDLAESLASMHFPEAVERGGPVPVVEVLAPHRLSAIAGVPVRPVVEDALVEDGASEYVSGELVLRLRGEVREEGRGRRRSLPLHNRPRGGPRHPPPRGPRASPGSRVPRRGGAHREAAARRADLPLPRVAGQRVGGGVPHALVGRSQLPSAPCARESGVHARGVRGRLPGQPTGRDDSAGATSPRADRPARERGCWVEAILRHPPVPGQDHRDSPGPAATSRRRP